MKEIKISSFPPGKDFKNFKNIAKNRQKIIEKSSSSPIQNNYSLNELANKIYPKSQNLIVKNIIDDTEDIKTFYFASAISNSLATFKPGQFLTLLFEINENFLSRPFSLTTSPKDALNNVYRISVKRNENGTVSNYMFDNIKIGDTIMSLCPSGDFTTSSIRDRKHIVALAEDIGITPFISFARSIYEKSIDKELTIFYLVESEKDIIYKQELDKLIANPNIKVIYVDKSKDQNITISLIKNYVTSKFSVFACGSKEFLDYLNEELKAINLERKDYRFQEIFIPKKEQVEIEIIEEIQIDETNETEPEPEEPEEDNKKGEKKDKKEETTEETEAEPQPEAEPEEEVIPEKKIFNIKVFTHDNEYNIECPEDETILSALERSKIKAKSKCRVGECGFCRSLLIWGEVDIDESKDKRRIADKNQNYIHPCITKPKSDITIRLDI